MPENNSTQEESSVSTPSEPSPSNLRAWIKVGAIAAASALAGGLAAAWYYRKTLDSLREAELAGSRPAAEFPDSETEYDI